MTEWETRIRRPSQCRWNCSGLGSDEEGNGIGWQGPSLDPTAWAMEERASHHSAGQMPAFCLHSGSHSIGGVDARSADFRRLTTPVPGDCPWHSAVDHATEPVTSGQPKTTRRLDSTNSITSNLILLSANTKYQVPNYLLTKSHPPVKQKERAKKQNITLKQSPLPPTPASQPSSASREKRQDIATLRNDTHLPPHRFIPLSNYPIHPSVHLTLSSSTASEVRDKLSPTQV